MKDGACTVEERGLASGLDVSLAKLWIYRLYPHSSPAWLRRSRWQPRPPGSLVSGSRWDEIGNT